MYRNVFERWYKFGPPFVIVGHHGMLNVQPGDVRVSPWVFAKSSAHLP